MEDTRALKIMTKFNSLRGNRAMWESLWQEIADYVIPRKNDIQNTQPQATPKYTQLLDSTAMTDNELLSGALHGMLTNPAGYFFNLSTGNLAIDQRDDVRRWIQDVVRILHDAINNANFQTEVHELYLDLCAFGTACMSVEDGKDGQLTFNSRPLKEVYMVENAFGRVDEIIRQFRVNGRGLIDLFGEEALPEKTLQEIRAGKVVKYEVLHAVCPREETGKPNRDGVFKYTSDYVLVCEKKIVKSGGFRDFPYLVPRWSKATGEDYGRGPGERALPSAKTLNEMKKTTLRGAQKVVDPPLMAPDDGFVLPLNTKPGGLNYYRAGSPQTDRIAPIFNDARVDFGMDVMNMEKQDIHAAFYVDQLKLREGPQMTATEVAERVEQALRFLGPMLGRMQTEFLRPLVERTYYLKKRKGEIPEPPAIIANMPVNVQYSSVAAMSQRMSEAQNINRTMAGITPFAAADQAVLDNIDGDKALRYIAKLYNFPQELIRDVNARDQIRKARAEAQAQAEQAALGEAQSKELANVATANKNLQVV